MFAKDYPKDYPEVEVLVNDTLPVNDTIVVEENIVIE